MSDSLRDQLLKAGFTAPEPKKESRRKKKPNKKPSAKSKNTVSTPATGAPVQTEPKAGYTHVPTNPVKKKKKSKKAPAVKPREGSWGTRTHTEKNSNRKSVNPEQAAKRQAMQTEVKRLIDASAIKNFKGDVLYRFTLKNKIRELQVSDLVRKQLVAGELAITRANGTTQLVPFATAKQIREINPKWLCFLATDVDDSSEDDDEFPVPDDLIW